MWDGDEEVDGPMYGRRAVMSWDDDEDWEMSTAMGMTAENERETEAPCLDDDSTLARVFEPYRAFLTLVARRSIGPALAGKVGVSDIVQETFLAAQRLCWHVSRHDRAAMALMAQDDPAQPPGQSAAISRGREATFPGERRGPKRPVRGRHGLDTEPAIDAPGARSRAGRGDEPAPRALSSGHWLAPSRPPDVRRDRGAAGDLARRRAKALVPGAGSPARAIGARA